jgi:hypothetical protein
MLPLTPGRYVSSTLPSVTCSGRGNVGPPSEADRAQGDAFCDELQVLIAELDEKVVKLRTELTRYRSARREAQVSRVQGMLRAAAVERRKMLDMLIGIGHSYPCSHRTSVGNGRD